MTLSEMLEKYRDLKIELAGPLGMLAGLEKQIKDHVRDTGETAEIDGASVTVRPGSVRVSWDTKALEGVVVMYPQLAALRSEKETAPVVTLKVK